MIRFYQNLLTASIHGSVVILAVMLLRLLLKKTPRKYICFLWMLAGIRLLMPISVQSAFSLQPTSIRLPAISSQLVWIVWGCVAALIVAGSLLAYLRLQKQVKGAVKVRGGYESDQIETAFVLGFFKPKIYIPSGMSPAARTQILAHERTHLEKGDHWIKVIAFLALALHWFNPLVWVAYLMLCKDIEIACDERVVQFMELDERKQYASALLQCSTNRIYYAACPVAFGEVSVKYRIQSALSYRKPAVWMSLMGVLSIADNISIASLKKYVDGGIMLNSKKIEQLVQDNVQKMNIKTPSSKTLIQSLSGGNQQKVLIGRWLANDPEVLILDEPTRGIDVGAKYEIYCIIAELAKQGKSIIMISSEMGELIGMSDRIMVMCDGKVTGFIDSQDATQESVMSLATQFS